MIPGIIPNIPSFSDQKNYEKINKIIFALKNALKHDKAGLICADSNDPVAIPKFPQAHILIDRTQSLWHSRSEPDREYRRT